MTAQSTAARGFESVLQDPEFLSAVCHELRGPLGAIGTWVHVLSSGKAEPEVAAQALLAIERSVRLQAQLVSSLSDLASAAAGTLRLSRSPVNVGALVASLAEALMPQARELGVTLQSESAPGLVVSADADKLQSALAALVDDALRRTARGGRVALHARSGEGRVVLAVERAEPATRPAQPSRAPGLRVVFADAVVSLHGGSLRPGDGSPPGHHVELPVSEEPSP
jgi:signal transduction histidine kinase